MEHVANGTLSGKENTDKVRTQKSLAAQRSEKTRSKIDNSLLQHDRSHSRCQKHAIFKQPKMTSKKVEPG